MESRLRIEAVDRLGQHRRQFPKCGAIKAEGRKAGDQMDRAAITFFNPKRCVRREDTPLAFPFFFHSRSGNIENGSQYRLLR
jgi:hypothetical protein